MKRLASLVAWLALAAGPAFADAVFTPVPPAPGQGQGLEPAIVHYDGHTNGQIEVDVRNPTDRPLDFVARGMYFVPNGDRTARPNES
jgi:hypothetical protein